MKPSFVVLFLSLVFLFVNGNQRIKLQAGTGLAVEVDTNTGEYDVLVDGVPWLSEGFQAFYSNSAWFTNGLGFAPLKLVDSKQGTGYDALLGDYSVVSMTWMAGDISIITDIKSYDSTEALVFTQSFPQGLPTVGLSTSDDVVTAFPGFKKVSDNYYFTFSGTFAYPVLGQFNTSLPKFGIQTGNPLLIYNNTLRTLMISPLDTFMVSENVFSPSLNNSFAVGLQGFVESVPAGFEHSTILYASQGINATFIEWGDILLNMYGKQRTALDADVVLKYLGYWTDNGGYYWYNPEQYKNYEQTVLDVRSYHKQAGLPVNYYQFDSWWYFKENSSEYLSALKLWEPRPDVFPDGFGYISSKIDSLPIALHNRHFSAVNDYIGNFSFIVESSLSLPIDENLFLHIMGKAQTWGLQVYEQDWMVTTYTDMKATQNSVSNSRTWLLAMGNAASKLGLTIQYCMDLPIMVMQSVEIPAVTQVRASIDYQDTQTQWQVAYTGLFIWALGAVPFKDDFWTTSYQSGCVFPQTNCTEHNPQFQALVASLSAGPVGPSDKIGATNVSLALMTCTATGLLLKPSKPATPIDQVFLDFFPSQYLLQIWDTYTQIGQNRWHYVLAAELPKPFTLEPSHLDIPSSSSSLIFDYFQVLYAYQNQLTLHHQISYFNSASSFTIPAQPSPGNGLIGYNYYVIAPIVPNSPWILLGEISKFIPVSGQRISQFTIGTSGVTASIYGNSGESLDILLSPSNNINNVTVVTCNIPASEYATLSCPASSSSSCTCA